MSVIVVLGTGRAIENSFEYDTAQLLGRLLAKNGYDVATGGYGGVMEAALKGASSEDVNRIGVLTEFYDREPNEYVTEVIKEETYLDRLVKLIEIGDAFVVMPGGTGTLLEWALIWAYKDRKIIENKPTVCIGEQWHEVTQTMSFYSERVLDNADFVDYADNAEEAVKIINEKLKK